MRKKSRAIKEDVIHVTNIGLTKIAFGAGPFSAVEKSQIRAKPVAEQPIQDVPKGVVQPPLFEKLKRSRMNSSDAFPD